ncbi:hypothetical protein Naga_101610g1, partial [Nannochloropsis gaditana]
VLCPLAPRPTSPSFPPSPPPSFSPSTPSPLPPSPPPLAGQTVHGAPRRWVRPRRALGQARSGRQNRQELVRSQVRKKCDGGEGGEEGGQGEEGGKEGVGDEYFRVCTALRRGTKRLLGVGKGGGRDRTEDQTLAAAFIPGERAAAED